MICYNLKHSNSRLNGKRWGVETALKRPYIPDKSPLLLTIKSIISQQVNTYTPTIVSVTRYISQNYDNNE